MCSLDMISSSIRAESSLSSCCRVSSCVRDPTESHLLIRLLLPFLLNPNQRFKVRTLQHGGIKCAILQEVTLVCKFLLQKNEENILLSICSLVTTAENVAGFYRCSVITFEYTI